jgi:hypothetical protein
MYHLVKYSYLSLNENSPKFWSRTIKIYKLRVDMGKNMIILRRFIGRFMMKKITIGGLCLLFNMASMGMDLQTRLAEEGYTEAQQLILGITDMPNREDIEGVTSITPHNFEEKIRNPEEELSQIAKEYFWILANKCDTDKYRIVSLYDFRDSPDDVVCLAARAVYFSVFYPESGLMDNFIPVERIKEFLNLIIREGDDISRVCHVDMVNIELRGTVLDSLFDHFLKRWRNIVRSIITSEFRKEREIKERMIEIYKYLVEEKGARHSQDWKDSWEREGITPMEKTSRIYAEAVENGSPRLPDGFQDLWNNRELEELWNLHMRNH